MASVPSYCSIRNNKIVQNGTIFFERPGVPLDDFMSDAYSRLDVAYPRFYKMDRLSKLGFLASEILLGQCSPKLNSNTAVVLSNANSSLDTDLRYWESVKTQASPSLFVCTLPNIVAGEICIRNGFKGENVFFVLPNFDPAWTDGIVTQIFEHGNASHCLAGWVDVLGDQADVFLYLTDHSLNKQGLQLQLFQLYHSWNN